MGWYTSVRVLGYTRNFLHGTTHALDIANQLATLLLSGNFFSCEGMVACINDTQLIVVCMVIVCMSF